MRPTTVLLTVALLCASGCADAPSELPRAAVLDDAVAAMAVEGALAAGLHIRLSSQVVFEPMPRPEFGGEDDEDHGAVHGMQGGTPEVPDPVSGTAEYVVSPSGDIAFRSDVAGLVRRGVFRGDGGWLRMGAAVDDLSADRFAGDRANRGDLLCMLAAPLRAAPFTVEALDRPERPAAVAIRREGTPLRVLEFDAATGLPSGLTIHTDDDPSSEPASTTTYTDWQPWESAGGAKLPRIIVEKRTGRTRTTTVEEVRSAADVVEGVTWDRPDDSAPGTLGEFTRKTARAANVVAVRHRGPLTDIAQVHLYLLRGLRAASATPKGPISIAFDELPDADGVASFTVFVPAGLSREPDSGDLPRGAKVETTKAHEVIAAEYCGPYPRDGKLRERLEAAAREMGAEPAGTPRYLLLSDPEDGAPGDLRLEAQLPVTN